MMCVRKSVCIYIIVAGGDYRFTLFRIKAKSKSKVGVVIIKSNRRIIRLKVDQYINFNKKIKPIFKRIA